jgi:predicted ArsR family transcriptional regulator
MAKYQPHSDTSREAAEQIEPREGTLRRLVLDYLRKFGPSTDEQMQENLEMAQNTQRPRRIELVDRGFVRDSGRTAPTKSGRAAVLWEIRPQDPPQAQQRLF